MDLNNMQTWQYFAFAGGGLLVIAVVLYFIPAGKLRLPGVVTAGFGGTALGLALGVLLMASFGYKPRRRRARPTRRPPAPRWAWRGRHTEGGRVRRRDAQGGARAVPAGATPRSSKAQLAGLVTALDRSPTGRSPSPFARPSTGHRGPAGRAGRGRRPVRGEPGPSAGDPPDRGDRLRGTGSGRLPRLIPGGERRRGGDGQGAAEGAAARTRSRRVRPPNTSNRCWIV